MSAGNALIKEFENFIVPIVHAHAHVPPGTDYRVASAMVDKARTALLGALNDYVATLVQSYLPQQTSGTMSTYGGASRDDGIDVDNFHPAPEVQVNPIPPSILHADDSLRIKVVARITQHCHTNMPIRMLTFSKDGTDIKLVDRGAVSRIITARMDEKFDELAAEVHQQNKSAKEGVIIDKFCSRYWNFAILSHTWLPTPGEVTYTDWQQKGKTPIDQNSPGYRKLAGFCRVAASYGHTLAWADSVCINKESSQELDESIRSMYKWYNAANICIIYLGQTTHLQDIHKDRWFSRGWTLQELIAPHFAKFHNKEWHPIISGTSNDKKNDSILHQIKLATTLSSTELDPTQLHTASVSRKMEWAGNREVTREEDAAYSLMGIFEVSIPAAYGEGAERAFVRLLKEIISTTTENVLDIINWGHGDEESIRNKAIRTTGLLPPSPKHYKYRERSGKVHWKSPNTPVTLTHLGLHVPVLLMPALSTEKGNPVTAFVPKGGYYGTAENVHMFKPQWPGERENPESNRVHNFHILDRNIFQRPSYTDAGRVTVFGALNIMETPNEIHLPAESFCHAVLLKVYPRSYNVHPDERLNATIEATKEAVVFELKFHDRHATLAIRKEDLAKHGMTFRIMYL